MMSRPDAATATHGPKLEKLARWSSRSAAATAITSSNAPGQASAVEPELPAIETRTAPLLQAYATASAQAWGAVDFHRLMLMTCAPLSAAQTIPSAIHES